MAIKGATICATLAMRFTPPMMTRAMSEATTRPTTQGATPKACDMDSAMPLHCTGGMKRPQAMAVMMAKTQPKRVLCSPFSM